MSERPISTDPQVHLRHHLNFLLEEQRRLNEQIPTLHASLRSAEERLNEISRRIDKTRSLIRADHNGG